jgi:hypothetical protein
VAGPAWSAGVRAGLTCEACMSERGFEVCRGTPWGALGQGKPCPYNGCLVAVPAAGAPAPFPRRERGLTGGEGRGRLYTRLHTAPCPPAAPGSTFCKGHASEFGSTAAKPRTGSGSVRYRGGFMPLHGVLNSPPRPRVAW